MNTIMMGQTRSINFKPEKLYTQHEVDDLVEIQATEKQIRRNSRSVDNLVKKSNRILVSISTHGFPFDLFPTTINIEEGRITIIERYFLSSAVQSVDIKNISNIFINTSLFRSQLVIISKTFEENKIEIRNLKTKEAIFIRRIIEGLRVFEDKQIDTSNYTKEELIAKLEELSTTEIVM